MRNASSYEFIKTCGWEAIARNSYSTVRLNTVDLRVKLACFAKKKKNNIKAAALN